MRKVLIALLSFISISCATKPTYTEKISMRPIPGGEQARIQECSWIRSEIARMQSVSAYATTSPYALAFQAKARKNIAALESRAANIGCNAAFSSVVNADNKSSIDECIEACKGNTDRTPEECFDACNH